MIKIKEGCETEVSRISELIPAEGTHSAQRMIINKVVRGELSKASLCVLVLLIRRHHHQLSLIELRKRFDQECSCDIWELFALMESVLETDFIGAVATQECVRGIIRKIGELASDISQEEAMEILRASRGLKLFARTWTIPMFLAVRSDMKFLVTEMREEMFPPTRTESIVAETRICKEYL